MRTLTARARNETSGAGILPVFSWAVRAVRAQAGGFSRIFWCKLSKSWALDRFRTELLPMKRMELDAFRVEIGQALEAVQQGETVLVMRAGEPLATLAPCALGVPVEPSWKQPFTPLELSDAALVGALGEGREDRL